MKVTPLELPGLLLVELDVHSDERGFFVERFHRERFARHGLPTRFAQDNHSRSMPGVLRGLHYQHAPPMGKLVGVLRGRVWDVAVDIRPDSPTFGRHMGLELSRPGVLLWLPPGFAHGMCVLGGEAADFFYKTDAHYDAAGEGGILWADPELAIPWPVASPLLSAKDGRLPSFAEYRARAARAEIAWGGSEPRG